MAPSAVALLLASTSEESLNVQAYVASDPKTPPFMGVPIENTKSLQSLVLAGIAAPPI